MCFSKQFQVQIYSSRTHQSLKTLSKFKSTAYGASFRGDGKLLVSGEENRGVWLFDANSGSVLRMLTGHSGYDFYLSVTRCQILNS